MIRSAACALSLFALSATLARATDPDEVDAVRVSHANGRVALTWQPPAMAPDSYAVRRCLLPSLRGGAFGAPYFGDCVATGLVTTSWDEPEPAGSVFYLVSGWYSGTEGSLGESFNGLDRIPRVGPDCGSPSGPGEVTVVVTLDDTQWTCASQLVLLYPADALTFVSADCSGLQAGCAGDANATIAGRIVHACARATGVYGSGEIASFTFQRVGCPVSRANFSLESCRIIANDPDCGTPLTDASCHLSLR